MRGPCTYALWPKAKLKISCSLWFPKAHHVAALNGCHREAGHLGVKKQNVRCHLSIPYPVDNSDSPSVVEQSQQGISFNCILFIIPPL